jgi:thymidylate kinase
MGFLGGYFLPIEKLSSLYRAIFPRPSIASEDKEIEENPLLYTTSSFKLGLMSFLLALEYLVRNTVIIWYAYFRKKTILLDRSIFDQHTKFSKLKIISFLRRFLVKPDIFIFLKGDTSIFFRRKQEYQISTLKFSQEANLEYLRKNFPLKLNELDANQSLQTVHLQAMDLLSEKLR